jgi:hypothetical protein
MAYFPVGGHAAAYNPYLATYSSYPPSGYHAPSNFTLPVPFPPPYAVNNAPQKNNSASQKPTLWQRFTPTPRATTPYGYNPQSMVISLNTPKMSKQDFWDSFWIKFAATTASFVAGCVIIGLFGMKVLPKSIAVAMGEQVHRTALKTLSPASLAQLLKKINSETLIWEKGNASAELKKNWGHMDAHEIYRDKQTRKRFLKAVEPHAQVSDTCGLVIQQSVRAMMTPEMNRELMKNLGEGMLSSENKTKLLAKSADAVNVREAMAKEGLSKAENLGKLAPEQQGLIMKEVMKNTTVSEAFSHSVRDTMNRAISPEFIHENLGKVGRGLNEFLVHPENLSQAMDSPSVSAQLSRDGLGKSALSPEAQKKYASQHLSHMDAMALMADGLSRTGVRSVTKSLEESPGILGFWARQAKWFTWGRQR